MKILFSDPRFVLAFVWSIVTAILLCFITYKYGDKVEILTLIIGTLTGTITGGIFGYYFGATHSKQAPGATTTEVSTSITETK